MQETVDELLVLPVTEKLMSIPFFCNKCKFNEQVEDFPKIGDVIKIRIFSKESDVYTIEM